MTAIVISLGFNACWYGWSIAKFGLYTNVASNATWKYIQAVAIEPFLYQQFLDLKTTLIPHIWQWDASYLNPQDPSLTLYALYQKLHLYWATTLIGGVSEILLVLCLLLLLFQTLRPTGILSGGDESDQRRDQKLQIRFVLILCIVAFVLSLPLVAWGREAGMAHLSSSPCASCFFDAACSGVRPSSVGSRDFYGALHVRGIFARISNLIQASRPSSGLQRLY